MKTQREWFRIQNSADGPAEIYIYDVIGESFWDDGVSAKGFTQALDAIDATDITVRINSPGGDVYDGIAILNALRNHPAKITTVVDGIAASAASFIAMAGDEIVMSRNSEMMIHDASGVCMGNADDMRGLADRLERMSNNIASIYADRAKGSVEDWRAAMHSETWYSDQEAVDAGLADRVEAPAKGAAAKAKNKFDLSIFNYAGRAQAPTPPISNAQVSSAAEAEAQGKEGTMPTLKEGLAQRLGIPADADDETTLQAIDEALAERADDAPVVEEPAPDQIAAHAEKLGLTLVDRVQYEATVTAAAEGRLARQQQLRDSDESIVTAAIGEGRIPPARRDHWLTALASDREGMTQTLNSLPKGLVPMDEIGHGVNPQDDDGDDGTYAALFGKDA